MNRRDDWALVTIGATLGVLLIAGLLGLQADQRPAICSAPTNVITVATETTP